MAGRMFAFAAVIFAMLPLADASDGALRATLNWRMSLDAEGHIAALSPQGSSNGALKAKLEPVVRAWEFIPGAVNGQPAATDTMLTIQVVLKPISDSEQFSVLVEDVRTGGRIADAVKAPRFQPKSSLSTRDAGIAAQLSARSSPLRPLARWTTSAMCSLPVPVSPSTKIGRSDRAIGASSS